MTEKSVATQRAAESASLAAQDTAAPSGRRHFLCIALWVAALANALVPALFFSDARLFGHVDSGYRALIALVVVAEYAIAFLLLLVHSDVGFASGYSVATATIVTLGSAMLAISTLDSARGGWNVPYTEIPVVGGFAFAVVSNAVFLGAGIRYARAIHPRLHRGGFLLGIVASLALIFLYARILS